jgi:hypothetical protein
VAASRVDPIVYVAYTRCRNLLDPPAAFWRAEDIVSRVRSAIRDGAPSVIVASPSRADFDALA